MKQGTVPRFTAKAKGEKSLGFFACSFDGVANRAFLCYTLYVLIKARKGADYYEQNRTRKESRC